MTPLETRIAAIKAECEEVLRLDGLATAGPWYGERMGTEVDGAYIHTIWDDENCGMLLARTCFAPASLQNARMIVKARTVTPAMARAMLAAIDALESVGFTFYPSKIHEAFVAIADAWEGK